MMFLLALLGTAISGVDALVGRCKLGTNGPMVSCIAYGTLHLHEAGTASGALTLIKTALSAGITTFDLSDVYQDIPSLFGQAIQLEPGLRNQMEIIAKMDIVGGLNGWGYDSGSCYDTSCSHLNDVLTKYLTALNTTMIDIVLLHRQDYIVDVVELSTCVNQWITKGTVKYFGLSNFDIQTFTLVNQYIPLVANQIEVSPLNPSAFIDGRISYHYRKGSAVLAWSALGGDPWGGPNRLFKVGSLDGTPHNARIHHGLSTVAKLLGVGEDITALAWLMRHPSHIIPIIGTMNPSRLTNQSTAYSVAPLMTRQQWYHIADAVGIPLP